MTPDAIPATYGTITVNQDTAIFTRQDDGGWMRQWETPLGGRAYIVVMTGKALAVWRQPHKVDGEMKPARMIAAVVPDQRHHITVLTDWAWHLSKYYGDCLVMVDAGSCPGSLPTLKERGVMLWTRQQRDDKRPLGQGLPSRHIGWEMTEPARMDGLVTLQRMISDAQIKIPCAHTITEIRMTATNATNEVEVAQGYGSDWLNNAIMAAIGLPNATTYQIQASIYSGDYMTRLDSSNFDVGNMGS